MNFYKLISPFYDDFFSLNFEDYYDFLYKNIILNLDEKNIKILDVACGTAGIFEKIYGKYYIDGLDLSEDMLREAKRKFPKSSFFKGNMMDFSLEIKYDVAFCLFDSINHLENLEGWRKTFLSVYNSLNEGGVFFFDCNSLKKILSFDSKKNFILKKDNDYIIFNRKSLKPNKAVWTINNYKYISDFNYSLEQADLIEKSFLSKNVVKILNEIFKRIEFFDMSDLKNIKKINKLNEEITRYGFLCYK